MELTFCRKSEVHEPLPEEELPLKWSQAAPCIGKRVATLHLTATSDSELKLIWSGAQRSAIIARAFTNGVWRARPIMRASVATRASMRACPFAHAQPMCAHVALVTCVLYRGA